MKKSELIKLRKQVKEEIARRDKINQYLDSKDVLEYLNLIGVSTKKRDPENIREMLIDILKDFTVKETNGIYVCTKAFDMDSHAPVIYYFKPESKCSSDYMCYKDIESGKEFVTDCYLGPTAYDFERSHIVLNPYNAAYNDKNIKNNGYEEVRLDFFEESYKSSQSRGVQKVLEKYPKIGSKSI